MNLGNGYAKYREQSVLTAGPGDLVVMLYDGALRQLRIAIAAISSDSSEPEKASGALLHAQDIICELMQGLDFQFEISNELMQLYEYFNHQLILANIRKDCQVIESVYELIAGLRDAWAEVVKISRQQDPVAAGG